MEDNEACLDRKVGILLLNAQAGYWRLSAGPGDEPGEHKATRETKFARDVAAIPCQPPCALNGKVATLRSRIALFFLHRRLPYLRRARPSVRAPVSTPHLRDAI